MGRVFAIILLIFAAILIWKAFGPQTWNRTKNNVQPQALPPKGPDDDEEFLWRLERDRFKKKRAQEEAAKLEEERIKRAQKRYAPKPSEDATSKDKEPPVSQENDENQENKED